MKDTVRYLSQTQASDIPCGQESWTVHTISSRPLAEGGSSVASLPWPSGPLLTGARQLPWLLKEPPALTGRCWPWAVNTVKPEGSRWVFHTRSSAAYWCKSQILTSWISNRVDSNHGSPRTMGFFPAVTLHSGVIRPHPEGRDKTGTRHLCVEEWGPMQGSKSLLP